MDNELWYVVIVHTQNGRRIGIDTERSNSLSEAMSEEEALELASELSEDMGIPQFDNNVDVLSDGT